MRNWRKVRVAMVLGLGVIRTKFMRIVSAAALTLGALAIAACDVLPGDAPITITATPGPADLQTAAARAGWIALPADAIGPYDFPPGTNPLTGLPVVDTATLGRRPLAVKISNAPDSVRPQAGIGQADLVFEHYVEADLTRFTAIFLAQTPPRVGSVRSARLIDLDLPRMYGALLAYSGASEPIRARLAAATFAARIYEGVAVGEPLYYRDETIEAPHNLFVIPAQVWARAQQEGQGGPAEHLSGLVFSGTPPPTAQTAPAARVTIDYGPDRVVWTYSTAGLLYARAVDGVPHRDANTDQQVRAANVVLIYARHADDTSIVESQWQGVTYYSTAIELLGQGRAIVCRDGRRLEGFWRRTGPDEPLSFSFDAAGMAPIALRPGTTWFQVVPASFTGVDFAP